MASVMKIFLLKLMFVIRIIPLETRLYLFHGIFVINVIVGNPEHADQKAEVAADHAHPVEAAVHAEGPEDQVKHCFAGNCSEEGEKLHQQILQQHR